MQCYRWSSTQPQCDGTRKAVCPQENVPAYPTRLLGTTRGPQKHHTGQRPRHASVPNFTWTPSASSQQLSSLTTLKVLVGWNKKGWWEPTPHSPPPAATFNKTQVSQQFSFSPFLKGNGHGIQLWILGGKPK
jgi:hypothetical protein